MPIPSGGYLSWQDSALAGLWVVDPESGEKRRLLPYGELPSWSPDGTRLAFSTGQIWVADVDGRNPQLLPTPGASFYPTWSPDGLWIAFDMLGDDFVFRVSLMRSDGTERHTVEGEGAKGSRDPSWSPDGSRLLHYRSSSGSTDIFSMKVDGSDLTRITFDRRYDSGPAYSPDGTRIAFSSQLGEGLDVLPQIWVMNVDGSCPRQLTADGGTEPAWSPTGRELVYSRYNWQSDSPENGVLWIIDVATLHERQLTSKWPQHRPEDAAAGVTAPRSPSGPRSPGRPSCAGVHEALPN